MDKDIKDKWLTALRTRRLPDGTPIKQTQEVLRRPDSKRGVRPLCCLGVLCEIAVQEEVIAPPVRESEDSQAFSWPYTYVDAWPGEPEKQQTEHIDEDLLPPVVEWANTLDSNPKVTIINKLGETEQVCLSILNDEYELSFDEIAELIEQQL